MSDNNKKNGSDESKFSLPDGKGEWGDISKITEEEWSSAVDDWDLDIPVVDEEKKQSAAPVTERVETGKAISDVVGEPVVSKVPDVPKDKKGGSPVRMRGAAPSDEELGLPDLDDALDDLFTGGEALGKLLGGSIEEEERRIEVEEDSTRIADSMDDLIAATARDDAADDGFGDQATRIAESMDDLIAATAGRDLDSGDFGDESTRIAGEELSGLLERSREEEPLEPMIEMDEDFYDAIVVGDSEAAEELTVQHESEASLAKDDDAKPATAEEEKAEEPAAMVEEKKAEEPATAEEDKAEEPTEKAETVQDAEGDDGDVLSIVSEISDELGGGEEEEIFGAKKAGVLPRPKETMDGILSGTDIKKFGSDMTTPLPTPAGLLGLEEFAEQGPDDLLQENGDAMLGSGLDGLWEGVDGFLKDGGGPGDGSGAVPEEITKGEDAVIRCFSFLGPVPEKRELEGLEPDSDSIAEPLFEKMNLEPRVPRYSGDILEEVESREEGVELDWPMVVDRLVEQLGGSEEQAEIAVLESATGQIMDLVMGRNDEGWSHYQESRNAGGMTGEEGWFLLRSQMNAQDWSGALGVCDDLVKFYGELDSSGVVLAQGLSAELSFWSMGDSSSARRKFEKLESYEDGKIWAGLGKLDVDIADGDLEAYAGDLINLSGRMSLDRAGAELLFMSGRVHLVLGQFEPALESWEKCLQADAEKRWELKRWAQRACHLALYVLGRWREAGSCLERFAEFAEDERESGVTATLLAEHYGNRLKDYDTAVLWAERARKSCLNDVPVSLERFYSYLLEKTGRQDDLVQMLRAGADREEDPKTRGAKLYALAFELERNQGDSAEARKVYLEALANNPEIKAALNGVGRTFCADKDLKAELEWRTSMEKDPDVSAYLYLRRYLLESESGDNDSDGVKNESGVAALVAACEHSSSNSAVLWEIARSSLLTSETKMDCLKKAISADLSPIGEAAFVFWLAASAEDPGLVKDDTSWWRRLWDTEEGARAARSRVAFGSPAEPGFSERYEKILESEAEELESARSVWALCRSASIALARGETALAEKRFSRAMESGVNMPEPFWGVVRIAGKRGDWERVNDALLERLAGLDLGSTETLVAQIRRAVLQEYQMDAPAESGEAYASALQGTGENRFLRRSYYRLLLREGDVRQASEEMEHLVLGEGQGGDVDPSILLKLGALMEWADRLYKACELYGKVPWKSPLLTIAQEELYLESGNWPVLAEEALAALQSADTAGDPEGKVRAYEKLARIDRDGRNEEFSSMMSYSSILDLRHQHYQAQRELEIYSAANKRWEDLLRVYGKLAETKAYKGERQAYLIARALLASRMMRKETCYESFFEAASEEPVRLFVLRYLDDYARKTGDLELLARCCDKYSGVFGDDGVISSIGHMQAGECRFRMIDAMKKDLAEAFKERAEKEADTEEDVVEGGLVGEEEDVVEGETVGEEEDVVEGGLVGEEEDVVEGELVGDEEDVVEGGLVGEEEDLVEGELVGDEGDEVEGELVGEEEDVVEGELVGEEEDLVEGETVGEEGEEVEVEDRGADDENKDGEETRLKLDDLKRRACSGFSNALALYEHNLSAALQWRFLALDFGDWSSVVDAIEGESRASTVPERQAESLVLGGIIAWEKMQDAERAAGFFNTALERDSENKEAFLWLAEIYRKNSDYPALAELLKKRLAVEDSAVFKVRRLWELSDILHSKLGLPEEAKNNLQELLRIKPDHSDALELIAGIYESDGQWEDAAEVLMRWGRVERDREKLVDIYWRLGVIFDEALDDPKKSAVAFSRVINLDKNHLPALNRLADIHEKLEEWKAAMVVTGRIAQMEDDPSEKIRQYIRLANILEHGYKDIRRAREALRRALSVNSADLSAIEKMAEFHRRREDTSSMMVHLDQSAAVMRGFLEKDPFDVGAFKGLERIFLLRRHGPMAWWCSKVLTALGEAGEQTPEALMKSGFDGRMPAERLVDTEIDDYIFPRAVPGGLRQVFKILGDSLWKYYKSDIKKYGLGRAHRLHGTTHEARHLADGLASSLGVPGYELYRCDKHPGLLIVEPGDPPIIIVGDSLLDGAKAPELEFLLARSMKLIQSRLVIPALLTGEDLAVLVAAVVRQYLPQHEVLNLDPKALAEATHRVSKMLSKRLKEELMPYAYECSNETLDFKKTGLLVRHGADRAGLLCCGSVDAALTVLRKIAGRLEVPPQKKLLKNSMRGVEEIEDLLRFIPSMSHMAIREKI